MRDFFFSDSTFAAGALRGQRYRSLDPRRLSLEVTFGVALIRSVFPDPPSNEVVSATALQWSSLSINTKNHLSPCLLTSAQITHQKNI